MVTSKTYKVALLVCCFQRIEVTRAFFGSLFLATVPLNWELEIFVLDDCSTDGTYEFLSSLGSRINLIRSTGNAFWAGGMRQLHKSIKNKFDYYLAANDDVLLEEFCFIRIADRLKVLSGQSNFPPQHCIVGSTIDPLDPKVITYGGLRKNTTIFGFTFVLEAFGFVDTCNMNFCLISAKSIERVGFLDSEFKHQRADLDFGLRLTANGGIIYVDPAPVGKCYRKWDGAGSLQPGISKIERIRRLLGAKEQPFKERFIFYKRYGGIFWIVGFISVYILALFPQNITRLLKLRNMR